MTDSPATGCVVTDTVSDGTLASSCVTDCSEHGVSRTGVMTRGTQMTASSTAQARAPEAVRDRRILRHATPSGWRGAGGLSRRIVLATGRRASGAAIEVTEGDETFLLGRGEPMARVTVHDHRAYGALLRSASVGLGTSYVAGWWDTDDLTSLVRALSRDTRPTA